MADDLKDRAIAVAELRARVEANTERARLTAAQRKLLEDSATIFDEPATRQDAAYLPRELVQVTLPHKNPGDVPLWTRTNGNLTIGIQPGADLATRKSYGYPYGTIPRLLLFWITTEAIRTKSPRLELGNSLSGFMAELGLNSANGGTGAKRSDARRLRDQMQRLFNSLISFHRNLEGVTTRKCSECTTSWTKHERAARWYVRSTLDGCRSGGGRSHVSDVPRAYVYRASPEPLQSTQTRPSRPRRRVVESDETGHSHRAHPSAATAGSVNLSSSALASLRSAVSRPSVNQA
jgi:hypothetical protein